MQFSPNRAVGVVSTLPSRLRFRVDVQEVFPRGTAALSEEPLLVQKALVEVVKRKLQVPSLS